jgi:hypothetical protein
VINKNKNINANISGKKVKIQDIVDISPFPVGPIFG